MMADAQTFRLDLTDDEHLLLVHGLNDTVMLGKGAPVLAPLVGAGSVPEFQRLALTLRDAVSNGTPLSKLDWLRAMTLAEICWASDVLGGASEFWANMSDERARTAVRSLQGKLVDDEAIQMLIAGAHEPTTGPSNSPSTDHALDVDLTGEERGLLLTCLRDWSQPVPGWQLVAPMVGNKSIDEFLEQTSRLTSALEKGDSLSELDWLRALVLTEIGWASQPLGPRRTGAARMGDEQALTALRSLQRKIVTGEGIQLFVDKARTTITG